MPAEEKVLCFERKVLEEAGLFQGLSLDVERYIRPVTLPANLSYRNRSEAEQDRRFKQLIPYVILINNDKLLRYRRGKGGEETRLHGLYSIGIGGHISHDDRDLFSSDGLGYSEGMWREVREEVAIEPIKESMVAVINDDSTDVGYVHFGVVHVVHVADQKAVGRRKGIVAPEFIPISEAVNHPADYETWSQLCLTNMNVILAKAASGT